MTRPLLTASELERELRALLGLVHRLQPALNHRPHLFHEQKDALARAVTSLIVRSGGNMSPTSFSAPQGDAGAPEIRIGRRSIPIERRERQSR